MKFVIASSPSRRTRPTRLRNRSSPTGVERHQDHAHDVVVVAGGREQEERDPSVGERLVVALVAEPPREAGEDEERNPEPQRLLIVDVRLHVLRDVLRLERAAEREREREADASGAQLLGAIVVHHVLEVLAHVLGADRPGADATKPPAPSRKDSPNMRACDRASAEELEDVPSRRARTGTSQERTGARRRCPARSPPRKCRPFLISASATSRLAT